ncbi:hypothetical protein RCL1_002213 [Eukaryota sp. TZLM3-RCL]
MYHLSSCTLLLSNLPTGLSDQILARLVHCFGTVKWVHYHTLAQNSFGIVVFEDQNGASLAVKYLPGSKLLGNPLSVHSFQDDFDIFPPPSLEDFANLSCSFVDPTTKQSLTVVHIPPPNIEQFIFQLAAKVAQRPTAWLSLSTHFKHNLPQFKLVSEASPFYPFFVFKVLEFMLRNHNIDTNRFLSTKLNLFENGSILFPPIDFNPPAKEPVVNFPNELSELLTSMFNNKVANIPHHGGSRFFVTSVVYDLSTALIVACRISAHQAFVVFLNQANSAHSCFAVVSILTCLLKICSNSPQISLDFCGRVKEQCFFFYPQLLCKCLSLAHQEGGNAFRHYKDRLKRYIAAQKITLGDLYFTLEYLVNRYN